MSRGAAQGEFDFNSVPGPGAGYSGWVLGRQMMAKELARRIHLPLGHPVEVWLYGGVRLRGILRLQEQVLMVEEDNVRHLKLVVDGVVFAYREMESCVRLD